MGKETGKTYLCVLGDCLFCSIKIPGPMKFPMLFFSKSVLAAGKL